MPAIFRFLSLPIPRFIAHKALQPDPDEARKMYEQIGHTESIAANAIPAINFEWYSSLLNNTPTLENLLGEVRSIASPLGFRQIGKITDSDLTRLTHPTLYLWGDQDSFASAEKADRLAALTPRATIEHFATFGHLPTHHRLSAAPTCADMSGSGDVRAPGLVRELNQEVVTQISSRHRAAQWRREVPMVMSPGSRGPNAGRELAGAWSAAAAAIVAVAGLFLVSDPNSGREGLIWILAPAVFVAAIAAGWLGVRARRDGEESGRWPAVVGFAIGGFFALALALALVGSLLGFE